MQEFKIFRALGLSFQSWFRNFIPFTILTGVLYAPIFIYLSTVKFDLEADDIEAQVNQVFVYPMLGVAAVATLVAPMLTYRVIQELNGNKVSMLSSVRFGVRGILPAAILAVVTGVLQQIPVPLVGAVASTVVTCIWFVAAPVAVAERINPISALSRSAELTSGRRWGIFGLTLLISVIVGVLVVIVLMPLLLGQLDAVVNLKRTSYILVGIVGVFHMFTGIVEAVSYALLRQDKDGVTHEQLAKVFE
jgi:hypothetical protein